MELRETWEEVNATIRRGFPGGFVVKNLPASAGDMVQTLIQEDPTCHGAAKPMSLNYCTYALEPRSLDYCACALEPRSRDY